MRKIISTIFLATMLAALVSCGGQKQSLPKFNGVSMSLPYAEFCQKLCEQGMVVSRNTAVSTTLEGRYKDVLNHKDVDDCLCIINPAKGSNGIGKITMMLGHETDDTMLATAGFGVMKSEMERMLNSTAQEVNINSSGVERAAIVKQGNLEANISIERTDKGKYAVMCYIYLE